MVNYCLPQKPAADHYGLPVRQPRHRWSGLPCCHTCSVRSSWAPR